VDLLLEALVEVLKRLEPELDAKFSHAAIVLGRDSSGRGLEGLPKLERLLYRDAPASAHQAGWDWSNVPVLLAPLATDLRPSWVGADLLGGQKTGFFLDQRSNIQLAAAHVFSSASEMLRNDPLVFASRPYRILDLFSYVGQWSTQMAAALLHKGVPCDVVCADASQEALDLARANVEATGANVTCVKTDLVEGLDAVSGAADFDLVICDPPAFAKKKKDVEAATSAYGKVNRLALRRVREGGLFVSCSCSGHLDEESFRIVLAKAAATNRVQLHLLARGGHSSDHLQMPGYPQGSYLKAWIARVERGAL
jgi:23S rRNA (cytosine1962-C5)-methyltransferase